MTTQELKNNIEKVLGNSIRCLLPSYWWKKLFHSVADRINEVEVDVNNTLTKSFKEFEGKHPDIADRTFYIIYYGEEQAKQQEKNKVLYQKVYVELIAKSQIQPCYIAAPVIGVYDMYLACVNSQILLERNCIVAPNIYIMGDKKWMDVVIYEDGSTELRDTLYGSATSITVDSQLSDTSTNPVQNKVVSVALNNKVDKVTGKGLSTEDFTTTLKTKLEGLTNYNDTAIQNAVNGLTTQLNTLVNGDASTAIESFNEITAFLANVTDEESLEGIVAGIEQQISTKQDTLVSGNTIKTINGQSILGEGDIVFAESGKEVYVGSTMPTDEDVVVWIDPNASIGDVDWDGVVVDEELSPTSTNPIQNKTVYALSARLDGIEAILDNIIGE